jgi:hypothetical protein
MGQKYFTATTYSELETVRDMFLTHPEICVPHKENGYWYGDIATDDDGDMYMLCVITEAEQYLTQEQVDSLLTELPQNFITDII